MYVVWLIIAVASSVILIILIVSFICLKTQNRSSIYVPSKRKGPIIKTIPNKIYVPLARRLQWGFGDRVPHERNCVEQSPTIEELVTELPNKNKKKNSNEIENLNLRILKKIGGGAFGTVFLAIYTNDICGKRSYQNVAVKQLKKRPTEEEKDEFLNEIQTMELVKLHPNVVEIIGFCTVEEPLQIVMEYVGCGDLLHYLRKVRDKHDERYGKNRAEPDRPLLPPTLGRYLDLMNSSTTSISDSSNATETDGITLRPSVTETMYTTLSQHYPISSSRSSLEYTLDHRELHDFATQIAKGMTHLHKMNVTHRDLAARNILIDENKVLKISDFGLSRNGIYSNKKNKMVPLRWLSIEAMRDNFYSPKSDVWAFGIVLWEIGTLGAYPYPTVSNHELLIFLSSGMRLEQPDNCSKYLYELMLHCWADKADDRPSFADILSKLEKVHQTIYVDFSELSSDYVFPPTKEQIQNNKLATIPKMMK